MTTLTGSWKEGSGHVPSAPSAGASGIRVPPEPRRRRPPCWKLCGAEEAGVASGTRCGRRGFPFLLFSFSRSLHPSVVSPLRGSSLVSQRCSPDVFLWTSFPDAFNTSRHVSSNHHTLVSVYSVLAPAFLVSSRPVFLALIS